MVECVCSLCADCSAGALCGVEGEGEVFVVGEGEVELVGACLWCGVLYSYGEGVCGVDGGGEGLVVGECVCWYVCCYFFVVDGGGDGLVGVGAGV